IALQVGYANHFYRIAHKFDQICFHLFFFQAEDGIRDRTVTGVQTCALPIYLGRSDPLPTWSWPSQGLLACCTSHPASPPSGRARSEERRVGKECRFRWWLVH